MAKIRVLFFSVITAEFHALEFFHHEYWNLWLVSSLPTFLYRKEVSDLEIIFLYVFRIRLYVPRTSTFEKIHPFSKSLV